MLEKNGKCRPKIVFLDLDGTIWSSKDISSLRQPLRLKEKDIIEGSNRLTAKLYPGVREFLECMKKAGIPVFSLSWNHPEIAIEALSLLGISHLFRYHYIEPHPHKGDVMEKALRKLGLSLKANEIVYVDDRDIHLQEIYRKIGEVCFIQMWRDTTSFQDLKDKILKLTGKTC